MSVASPLGSVPRSYHPETARSRGQIVEDRNADANHSAGSPLRVIDGTKGHLRQALIPVLVAVIILFLATVVFPLVINTTMASLSYEIRDQRIETAQIQARVDSLETRLLHMESTDYLREEAEKIGLVPASSIGVISLEDGTVQGGKPAK